MYTKAHVLNGQGHVALVGFLGGDKSIVDAARVSYAQDSIGDERILNAKDEKLIEYLMKNRHTSPFESVVCSFEVEAPIFVFRQWHRHRTWSYNEISARYTELPEKFYVPSPSDIGVQHSSNKQMRHEVVLTDEEYAKRETEITNYTTQCRDAYAAYEELIKAGWPRELARAVLPVSIFSRMVGTVNLHNLFHFLRLRLHVHAQAEIREYAEQMVNLILPHVPYAGRAFIRTLQMEPTEFPLAKVDLAIKGDSCTEI